MISPVTERRLVQAVARFGSDPFGVQALSGVLAYGTDRAFAGAWTVNRTALLGRMDGIFALSGTLDSAAGAELASFLPLLGCDALLAPAQTRIPGWEPKRRGVVLTQTSNFAECGPPEQADARALQTVLTQCASPWIRIEHPDAFYVDLSHRLRHRQIRSRLRYVSGEPAACALTIGETPAAALLGVACRPEYRGCGLASRMLRELCADLRASGKSVFLMTGAELVAFYRKNGFECCGEWGEYGATARSEE